MFKPPELSEDFINGLDSLPEDYDSRKYLRFIRYFGTHYIEQADMGARYGQQSQISHQSWGKMTDQEFHISASAGYSGM